MRRGGCRHSHGGVPNRTLHSHTHTHTHQVRRGLLRAAGVLVRRGVDGQRRGREGGVEGMCEHEGLHPGLLAAQPPEPANRTQRRSHRAGAY